MINIDNIPKDKNGAEAHLMAIKYQVLMLIDSIVCDNKITVEDIVKQAWLDIEAIDKLLEE